MDEGPNIVNNDESSMYQSDSNDKDYEESHPSRSLGKWNDESI